MAIAQTDRMEAIRKGAESIRAQNLLSDTFASVALEDIGACQHVIRTILGKGDLQVVNVKSQFRLLNLTSKDSILDVLAQDGDGRLVNIEIQRRDTVDHARRTRYYGSMIDKSVLDKGVEYDGLPDVYIIYISETDLWGGGETVYKVEKTLGKAKIPYDDGRYVVFVNAAVNDGSEAAKMMQYFKDADPDDMTQGDLSKRIRYLKREKGGYKEMCEVAEKIYTQGMEQGIEQGMERGIEQGIERGIEQGIERGIEQGEVREARKTAQGMYKSGYDVSTIAYLLGRAEKQVEAWLGLTLA